MAITLALIGLWAALGGWRSLLLTWLLPALLGPPCLYCVQLHEHAACAPWVQTKPRPRHASRPEGPSRCQARPGAALRLGPFGAGGVLRRPVQD